MLSFTIKIGNTTIWLVPIMITLGAVPLRFIVAYLQNRVLAKNFIQGKTDTKFLIKCYKIIAVLARTEKGRRNVYIYRMMVCATHLADGNEEKAMVEFNAFRRQEYQNLRWLYALFIQYFTGIKHQQILTERNSKESGMDADTVMQELIHQHVAADDAFEEKLASFREKLQNDFVAECLDTFVTIVHSQPE